MVAGSSRSSGPVYRFGVATTLVLMLALEGVCVGRGGVVGGGEGTLGGEFGGIRVALGAGEGEDLGAEDGGGTMHFTEVCQRKLSNGQWEGSCHTAQDRGGDE